MKGVMGAAPFPPDEPLRLAALRKAVILDTAAERAFDDLVRLAARICGTPIALVSMVDSERQWFKARYGLDVTETVRDVSFCAHAILEDTEVFVVPDTRTDERFANNPFVTGAPHIRFYAGAVLHSREGQPLGTLCVVDHKPRELTNEQTEALHALALLARDQLVMRANAREMCDAIENVKILTGLLPMCPSCRQVRDDFGFWRNVESYLEANSDAHIESALCNTCAPKQPDSA